jgi:hypothetical protein
LRKAISNIISCISILALMLYSGPCFGQGFNGRIIAGFNAAQIRGDDLAGFNKIGVNAGVGAGYEINKHWELKLHLLYSQRGSRSELFSDQAVVPTEFVLDYASIPLIAAYKEWESTWNNTTYYKLHFEFGLAYGRLVRSSINDFEPGQNGDVDRLVNAFNQNDLSWLAGFSLMFNPKWGMHFRYTRSAIPIYRVEDDPSIYYKNLVPFFLTFQIFMEI